MDKGPTPLLTTSINYSAYFTAGRGDFSGAGHISAFGAVLNPHNLEHLAGGSSGGSGAALNYDDIDIIIRGDRGRHRNE